ncbi:penicillin-binding protein 2 [Mitsuokella multacida]|uniref:Penicillin-binding protein 2 n=3 Tax=Mitsuokella multacida TaxID=52226 RepID=A0A414NYE9_9FIRM|nr:penicillin-binding protein 2 [Mitsuokella multacida]MBP7727199.1 penicillin-binding protein 2 [Mitsuokella sp.]MCF2583741.1 penicillin-binding protein 2 [Mitsuokella multacida]MDO5582437.1 penicillin-binding protein 2 [Mitsuokella multacida]RHF52485.1 penicillin-binding protein 2 [Mitsuokella multacida]
MLDNDEINSRLRTLMIISVLVIAVLIGRAAYLQIYQGEYYAGLADGNRIRIVPSMAPRGTFYDRNGELLVTNRPGFSVSLLPLTAPISDDVIDRLSDLLKVPTDEIKTKIAGHSGFNPIRIKTDVTPDIVSIIEEQKSQYPGVVIEVTPIRDYILKQEGAHTFGYVSEINDTELEKMKDEGYKSGDIIGKFGLEKVYDKELRGENGGQQVEVDVSGKPVQILGRKEPVPGDDLELTIDINLQQAAEKAVDEQLTQIGAHAAAAVVMNPQTGEILAMVSRPAFDPNLFAHGISSKDWNQLNNNPYHPMDNKTITGEYPPGSTFKIVTGTAALTEGVVTPDEQIFDSGHHWIIPKGNADGEALGWLNFRTALAHSDNVYFYEMGNRLGIDRLEKYARMFGLGAKTGIDLPYEATGLVANRRYKEKNFDDGEWYLSETFDAAIGQGFNLVTPLQAAMVMGEIAADGKRYKPHVVNRIIAPDGSVVKDFQPELLSQLDVPEEDIKLVQDGLHDVTKYGTAASSFRGFTVDIAGKTGTAENSQGRDHGWFVAYGPFDNPNIVVAVIVENGGYGSQSAVPIGRKILEAAFGLNQDSGDKK